jgi:hypothetical protein
MISACSFYILYAQCNVTPTKVMDVCICVVLCVGSAALRRADPPSKESYRPCKKYYKTEVEAKAQQRAV